MSRKQRKCFLVCAVLLAILLPALALGAAPAVPGPDAGHFYVLDQAGVLSAAAQQKIQATSKELAAKTKAQIVVVTVRSLQGTPAAEYALEILRQWGLGDKQLNNGVVLLVAVDDRKARIDVGYGLEGALPDGKTGHIQDDYMLPYFKNKQYEQGILNGYAAVVNVVAEEYNVTLDEAPGEPQNRNTFPRWAKWLLGLGLVGWLFMMIRAFYRESSGRSGGGSGSGGSGGGSSGGSSYTSGGGSWNSGDSGSGGSSGSGDSGGGGSGGGGGSDREW